MVTSIQAKIFLLLSLLIAMFVIGLIFLRLSEKNRKELIFQDRERERNEFFDKLLELKRLPLEDFARTYTYWDEMVYLVETGDEKWGYENLYTSLGEYEAYATWVYRTDFSLVYSATIVEDNSLREVPIPKEAFKKLFEKSRFCHFFVNTNKGIMEIHGITIHPTADYERKTPPRGYFFNGRLWDKEYVDELSKLTSSTISILPPIEEEEISNRSNNQEKSVITFVRTLNSWDGSPLMKVHVRSESPVISEFDRSSNQQFILSIIFALVLLVLVSAFLMRWVSVPLQLISKSLNKEDPNMIIDMQKEKTEFGDLARLIYRFFEQRGNLIKENTERKRAEEALRRAHDELERRVEERTVELAKVNEALQAEITERVAAEGALREGEERYRLATRATQDAIWDWDLITDKLWWNEGIQKIFGYPADVVGPYINWWYERVHPEDRERVTSGLYSSIDKGEEFWSDEYRYLRADGSYAYVFDRGYLMHDDRGKPVRMVGAISDLTERKQAEEQIKKSLKEKEVLLKEIHHRVKNNLQIVSSLLNLQSGYTSDKKTLEMFRESENRVKSMALIHERLYQSKDLGKINFANYIQSLGTRLFHSHGVNPETIKLNLSVSDIFLGIDTAIPCGLIINELISNSMRHAFPDGRNGEISIKIDSNNGKFILIVRDDGVGLPENLDFKNVKSLGLKIVAALASQLDGSIEHYSTGGTEFKITFKERKVQGREIGNDEYTDNDCRG